MRDPWDPTRLISTPPDSRGGIRVGIQWDPLTLNAPVRGLTLAILKSSFENLHHESFVCCDCVEG